MRKKLLTLLLVASTISSTLVPAQSVFADTTKDADVSIEETSSENQPSTSSGSKKLFEEVTEEDYKKLANIKYKDIKYGNKTRSEIDSKWESFKAKTVQDAYPISHEDIYIPDDEQTVELKQELTKLREADIPNADYLYEKSCERCALEHPDLLESAKKAHPYANNIYPFSYYRHECEISQAAKSFIASQQATYSQETGDCSLNAITELTNKGLIAQKLVTKEDNDDAPRQRMSRAQISYNALYITRDPLGGFHGDYSKNGQYTLSQKQEIVFRLKNAKNKKEKENDLLKADLINDLRWSNSPINPIHSLYSGMGPVSEWDIPDARAYIICNNGSAPTTIPTPTPIPGVSTSPIPTHFADPNNDLYTEDVYDNTFAHLTQYRVFQNPKEGKSDADKCTMRNNIKAWIYKYGGVGMSGEGPHSNYYNYTENCTYSNGSFKGTKHAMVIVGWDDTIPIEYFRTKDGKYQTKTKGAWLVKNSWNPYKEKQDIHGPELYQETYFKELDFYNKNTPFSYQRYFWLSYDSPCIDAYYGIAFENKDYYDNIYQYDGYQKNTKHANSSVAANIFTVKDPYNKPTADKAQELKCVGFETNKAAKYKVEIYRNIPSGGGPTDGTPVDACTKTGECPTEGIYTVELNHPENLALGERYSVVVTLTNTEKDVSGNNPTIAVEVNDNTNDRQSDHIGESYILDPDTNRWTDVAKMKKPDKNYWPENVRIKAMTVNTNTDSSEIRTTPKPTTPTQSPITDCAKLEMKASVSGGYTGFECTVETEEESPLTDQIQYIDITKTDRQGAKKSSAFPLSQAKKVKTENGRIARSIFLAIAPSDYENTIKLEIRDNNYHPVKFLLSGDAANTCTTSYSTSLKEYLDKLRETAITNNDSATENFANALIIHMTCAQNMYKTKSNAENDVSLSVLDSIKAADFASYKLKRETTDNSNGTLPQIGLIFNWKKINALSIVYYDVTDPSSIKSILVDGDDITTDNPEMYQFEEISGRQELTINISDIPISDFSKTHTITVEDTSGNQTVVKASVFSYIYSALKTNSTDQPIAKNYAKSLALLAKSYNQLDMSDTRYKDFFLF